MWNSELSYWVPFSRRVHFHLELPVLMWKETPLLSRVLWSESVGAGIL